MKPELPASHPSQKLFKAYSNARSYIKHLSKVYDLTMCKSSIYDCASTLKQKFISSTPRPSSMSKPSYFPRTHISAELLNKRSMISAYHNLECTKPVIPPKKTYNISFKKPIFFTKANFAKRRGYLVRLENSFDKVKRCNNTFISQMNVSSSSKRYRFAINKINKF